MGYWDALKEAISLLKDLSILEKVASKLINKPDTVAEKLSVVLSELVKSYQALDDALSISHHSPLIAKTTINESRRYLLEAQGGRIAASIGEARGHCHKIWNNYERYLRGWFSRVLDQKEASELENLFNKLREFDTSFVCAMETLSSEAQNTADNLLVLVDGDKLVLSHLEWVIW